MDVIELLIVLNKMFAFGWCVSVTYAMRWKSESKGIKSFCVTALINLWEETSEIGNPRLNNPGTNLWLWYLSAENVQIRMKARDTDWKNKKKKLGWKFCNKYQPQMELLI